MSNPMLPDEVYSVLVEECEKHPGPVQDDAVFGDVLNATAWRTRHLGMGLSRKTGGKRVPSPVGEIAEDVLQDRATGHHWDVLGGAAVGNTLNPGRGPSIGVMRDPNRPWVAPVEPRGYVTPPTPQPPAQPPPTPNPPPPPSTDLSAIKAQLANIVEVLHVVMAGQTETAGKLQHAIDNLFQSGGGSPSMLEHMDDVKNIVLSGTRGARFK